MSGDAEPAPRDVLHVEARYDDTEATVILDGKFDIAGVARFWGYVSAVLAPHPLSIAVDVRDVTVVDPVGLRVLVRAREVLPESHVWHAHLQLPRSALDQAVPYIATLPDQVAVDIEKAAHALARYNGAARYSNERVGVGSGAADENVRKLAAAAHAALGCAHLIWPHFGL